LNNSIVNKLLVNYEKQFNSVKKSIEEKEAEISRKKIEKKELVKELIELQKQKQTTSKNPKTIQSEISKLDRNIKLLKDELRKKLKKIYEQFLNNFKVSKKALQNMSLMVKK
jgi:chromosome segregation ATPase